jgi:small ligand-binding sensory domain FIST
LSTERDSGRAAASAAGAALRSGGIPDAHLAFVFATTSHGPGFTRVTRAVSETCGTRNVVGCSAAGVLAAEEEVEGGHGVAVLAVAGDLTARRFFVPLSQGDAARLATDIATAVGADAVPGSVLVLFTDSYNVDSELLLAHLGRLLPGVQIVGGGGSEDGSVGEISVFAGDASSSRAASGVLLHGALTATVGVCHAVRPVSPTHRVTRAEGTTVAELDGRPAYDALAAILPAPLRDDPRRTLASVLVGLPVAEDEFVARHLIAADPRTGHLKVAARVATGQELFFGVRDPYAARQHMQQVLARQSHDPSLRDVAGGLYVNCVGRGRSFHGVPGLETAYLRQHIGAMPIAGYFSGGEFAPGGGAPRLHQYTGVLTLLGGSA